MKKFVSSGGLSERTKNIGSAKDENEFREKKGGASILTESHRTNACCDNIALYKGSLI